MNATDWFSAVMAACAHRVFAAFIGIMLLLALAFLAVLLGSGLRSCVSGERFELIEPRAIGPYGAVSGRPSDDGRPYYF